MNTQKEKLSILSEMISFAKVGNTIKQAEYNFLFNVSQRLGVRETVFNDLFRTKAEHATPNHKQRVWCSLIALFYL